MTIRGLDALSVDMREPGEGQQAEIAELRKLVKEMGKATAQLLSGHDQLYDAFFHYLPDRNPLHDLGAQDARKILSCPEVKKIMEEAQ